MVSTEEWKKIYNKKLTEYDERLKKKIFDKASEVYKEQANIIERAKRLQESFGINTELPNCGNTLNNKIIEIQNEFQNSGISLFSQRDEEYGVIGSSFLGTAITLDMLDYACDETRKLEIYTKRMEEISQDNGNKSLETRSKFGYFFRKIKSIFFKNTDIHSSKEQLEEIEKNAEACIETDKKLLDYSIKNNCLNSIMKYIRSKKYPVNEIAELIHSNVVPNIERLGYQELIPQIKAIVSEYETENSHDKNMDK